MKPCFSETNNNIVHCTTDNNKDMLVFTKRLEKAIQRLANGLSSSKAGALIQVWMPEVSSTGRVLLSTEGLPFSISGVGDLLALFRCISCKYRFDSDPGYGDSMGAIGRVYHDGKPEMCLDVQQYDRSTYLRITEAQLCRIHATLIVPVFDGTDAAPSAVVEISHHDKSVEFSNIVQLFIDSLKEVKLRTVEIELENCKLGLRKWPVDVCSVPLSSIEDSNLPKKYPDERGISHQHSLGRAMQTGFGHVSDFLMHMGMDTLTNESHCLENFFNEGFSDCRQNDNSEKNNLINAEASHGFSTGIARCVSDSGSANTTQFPEMHTQGSVTPTDTVAVCQASMPMAQEADQDIQSDSLKQEERSDSKESDADGGTEAKKKENRLGGGAGKRLTYRDLEAHFGHGLKEAARRLGICPTTLKRACRRNGITRWPSRQISKLLKVWKQMGYNGEPPSWLLQNAISGNLRSENLAYVLNAGLHMGLNPRRCECSLKGTNGKARQGYHLSRFCGRGQAIDIDGGFMIDDDTSLKNLTHHGAFTAALHGASDVDFSGFQEGQVERRNHTWHAGQMASVFLQPSLACQSGTTTTSISQQSMHLTSELTLNKEGEGPIAFDLERTQRGGAGLLPALTDFVSPAEAEDVLMQPFHLSLGFDTTQNHLFH